MNSMIKELVEEFKKEQGNFKKKSEKINKEAKIAAKVNKKGNVEALEIVAQQTAVLSTICGILKIMAEHIDDSAEHLAMVILTTLEMEKELNE